jgi:hypothetical protein
LILKQCINKEGNEFMKRSPTHPIRSLTSILMILLLTGVVLGLSVACSTPQEEAPQQDVETPPPPSIEGLWAYTTIAPGGENEAALTGLFLFHQGIFVQQAINDGEPFDEQMGQAHTGTYGPAETGFEMVAEIAIGLAPSRGLSLRRDTEHQISAEHRGEELALTFGSGTVQNFKRVGDGEGEVFSLDDGRLALVDGHFVLVAAREGSVAAGSGSFTREGDSVSFHATRWFSVKGEEITYKKDEDVGAVFDGRTLTLADGTTFNVQE